MYRAGSLMSAWLSQLASIPIWSIVSSCLTELSSSVNFKTCVITKLVHSSPLFQGTQFFLVNFATCFFGEFVYRFFYNRVEIFLTFRTSWYNNWGNSIISTDEDPSLRIESSAIINLRGVSTKLNKYIVFTMQTYRKLKNDKKPPIKNQKIKSTHITSIPFPFFRTSFPIPSGQIPVPVTPIPFTQPKNRSIPGPILPLRTPCKARWKPKYITSVISLKTYEKWSSITLLYLVFYHSQLDISVMSRAKGM